MPIKRHKPTSPGRRFATWADSSELSKKEPEKALTEGLKKSGGRNTHGRITSRHRGGGAKRLYRKVDFKRQKDGVPARVAAIEYDPNRTAYIALINYADGDKRYILAPNRLRVGMPVECRATVGSIGNAEHQNITIGKAGRSRHKGIRPQTRGTAMNPVDHPHGGGEGKTTAGRHPVTPWGVPTIGYRTRKKGKPSQKFIVRGRRRGKKR